MHGTFNVKLMFRNGRCHRVEIGDFGPAIPHGDEPHVEQLRPEDCLLNWPVDPINDTGIPNLLRMLRVTATDRPQVVDLRG